jgi:hypothetical protein
VNNLICVEDGEFMVDLKFELTTTLTPLVHALD